MYIVYKFIYKTENGKYAATSHRLNVYLTIAALNRRLMYDERVKLNQDKSEIIKLFISTTVGKTIENELSDIYEKQPMWE